MFDGSVFGGWVWLLLAVVFLGVALAAISVTVSRRKRWNMAANTSAGDGWTCSSCGVYVMWNQTHECKYPGRPSYYGEGSLACTELANENARLRHIYAPIEHLCPPDIPRATFVRLCLSAWEQHDDLLGACEAALARIDEHCIPLVETNPQEAQSWDAARSLLQGALGRAMNLRRKEELHRL